jgi:hypothetical protein
MAMPLAELVPMSIPTSALVLIGARVAAAAPWG